MVMSVLALRLGIFMGLSVSLAHWEEIMVPLIAASFLFPQFVPIMLHPAHVEKKL